jgi:hypothetical protein
LSATLDVLEGHLRTVVTAATVLAACVYGACYLALSDYYAQFGLTPADAGVSQGPLVARAMTTFAFAGTVVVFTILGLLIGWSGLRSLPPAHALRTTRWLLPGLAWAAAIGVAILAPSTIIYVLGYTLVGLAAGTTLAVQRKPRGSWSRLRRAVLPYAAAFAAVVVALALVGFTDDAAVDAARGLRRSGDQHVANPFFRFALGIQAPKVTVKDGPQCARLIAADSNLAWVLVNDGGTVTVQPVDRSTLTIVFDEAAAACWRAP